MNKIAISLIALSLMATGSFASQRNNDDTTARLYLGHNDFGGGKVSSGEVESKAFAVNSGEVGGSAFSALAKRAMDRQNGDDN